MSDEEHSMLTQNFLKRFSELKSEIDGKSAMLLDGKSISLQEMKEKIEALCHDVQAAPADTAAAVKQDMADMISKLDELAHSLKTSQNN